MMQVKRITKQRSPRNTMVKKDIISTMPNEVIANILSRLTIKEAGRTSVLSTKWRYQWTNFNGVLNFDHSLKTYELRRERVGLLRKWMQFVSEWERFMNSLEHVLKSLKSPCMQGLRICMDMGNPEKLAEWLEFVAEKDVRMLDLDFCYHFHDTFFEISETIRNVLSPSTCFQMKSLCVLRLACVDVTGEVVEDFLASCPSLETLCVRESKLLVFLEVAGEALRLKHLELVDCCNFLYLMISAENLMTLRYSGDYARMKFECVPSLVEASFGGRYGGYFQSHMNNMVLFGLISHLDVLKLDCAFNLGITEGLPVFKNVKHLELQIPHSRGEELDGPVSLLSAFPSICVLKVKFIRTNLRAMEQEWNANLNGEFPNLEELEVSGYRRDPSQIKLLMSILEKTPNLKRIVVDPLSSLHVDRSPDVKARIRQLRRPSTLWFVDGMKQYVPPPIELVVL